VELSPHYESLFRVVELSPPYESLFGVYEVYSHVNRETLLVLRSELRSYMLLDKQREFLKKPALMQASFAAGTIGTSDKLEF